MITINAIPCNNCARRLNNKFYVTEANERRAGTRLPNPNDMSLEEGEVPLYIRVDRWTSPRGSVEDMVKYTAQRVNR